MLPLDLKKAQEGHPIMCRDGTPAKFIAYAPDAKPHSRVIYLRDGVAHNTHENGLNWLHDPTDPYDIGMVPCKKSVTYWINLYSRGDGTLSNEWTPQGDMHWTQQDADEAHEGLPRIGGKAWPFTFEVDA